MPYRYALENRDYSDYSSGRFFYGAPGHPALPVRLSSEIFQRCLAIRQADGADTPVTLYDPTCGSAYHLATLAFLHWFEINTIIASDIDPDILSVAERNLNLLTKGGLQKRIQEIKAMIDQFGKASHTAALASAHRFNQHIAAYSHKHQIETRLFTADATNPQELTSNLKSHSIDMVIADVPYGRHSNWQPRDDSTGSSAAPNPLTRMLDALAQILTADSVVAIVINKAQTFSRAKYRQVGKFQIGKRRIVLLKLV